MNTVWCMLDLLYTGRLDMIIFIYYDYYNIVRCVVTKLKDRFKLVNLLVSMGVYNVAHSLERETLYGDDSPQEYLDQSVSDRMSSSGSRALS